MCLFLFFAPNHAVDNADIRLDNLDDLVGNIFVGVIRNGDAEIAVLLHFDGGFHRGEHLVGGNAREHEIAFIICRWL